MPKWAMWSNSTPIKPKDTPREQFEKKIKPKKQQKKEAK